MNGRTRLYPQAVHCLEGERDALSLQCGLVSEQEEGMPRKSVGPLDSREKKGYM